MKKNILPHNMKYFSILYISLAIITISMLLIIFNYMRISLSESIIMTTENDVESFSEQFLEEISTVTNDVFLMKDLLKVHDVLVLDDDNTVFITEEGRTIVESEFLVWLSMNNTYDQMRILDNNGLEIVRVNYNQGNPIVVASENLQNKSSRYYFTESIILNETDIYLSPLDLNVENGVIELIEGQVKPMIRVASPVFDEDGTKLGVIIVNYLAGELFESLNRYEQPYSKGIEILNEEGYFLYANDSIHEFGFMYPDQNDETYSKYHEYDYTKNNKGKLETTQFHNELYSSVYISELEIATSASKTTIGDMNVVMSSGGFFIIAEVELYSLTNYITLRNVILAVGILLLIILLIIARLIDESRFLRLDNLKRMKFDSNHDVLTGLPNRKYVSENLAYLLSRNRKFTVLFLDFDGFKKINDKFGHETGDLALIEGASRIKNSIRQDDIISRMGGDEFVVVLKDLVDRKTISRVCSDINNEFTRKFDFSGKICDMGISIGIYINNDTGETVDSIIDRADQSMYIVKNSGKNSFVFFDDISKNESQ